MTTNFTDKTVICFIPEGCEQTPTQTIEQPKETPVQTTTVPTTATTTQVINPNHLPRTTIRTGGDNSMFAILLFTFMLSVFIISFFEKLPTK